MPFVVLQELDRLKGRIGDSRISNLASAAIRFIFNELKSKTQRLQGEFQGKKLTSSVEANFLFYQLRLNFMSLKIGASHRREEILFSVIPTNSNDTLKHV